MLKKRKTFRVMECACAASSVFERALRQNCAGENFIAVAISVNSWRRIVMAVASISLDGERILKRARTGRQRIPMDAMKRTTGGKKALSFVMERTKWVVAKCFANSASETCFGPASKLKEIPYNILIERELDTV